MYPRPKKRLGQHFLHDANIRRRIVDACSLAPDERVLEIGAGRGEITSLIAGQVERVWAVELDRRLCPLLKDAVAGAQNVEVVNENILKLDLSRFSDTRCKKITVIGNLPYYLSTPIIEQLINSREYIRVIYVMLQKEYAQRVAASSGGKVFGSLSCFVQYYMRPELLFSIPRGAFTPAPKVDSSFIKLSVLPRTPFAKRSREEQLFFKLVRAAFSQKRKTLRNSLKELVPAQLLLAFLEDRGLDPRVRPEQCGVEEFAALAQKAAGNKD